MWRRCAALGREDNEEDDGSEEEERERRRSPLGRTLPGHAVTPFRRVDRRSLAARARGCGRWPGLFVARCRAAGPAVASNAGTDAGARTLAGETARVPNPDLSPAYPA